MSDTVRPHRQQPTRLPRPWDSPGKNTGVGCHFLLQCRKVKSESEVAQSCPTPSDPMDCSLPGSSIHGILQARVLEWGAIAFSNWRLYQVKYYTAVTVHVFMKERKTGRVPHLLWKIFFPDNLGIFTTILNQTFIFDVRKLGFIMYWVIDWKGL